MNKADLTRMGITNDNIQDQILKQHNQELNKFRKEARELIPYRDAVHSAHLGYTSDEVPTPETPAEALGQLIQEIRSIFEKEAKQVMGLYSMGLSLLQQWQSHGVLSKEAHKELELTTANFLAQHRDPAANAEKHECSEFCDHG